LIDQMTFVWIGFFGTAAILCLLLMQIYSRVFYGRWLVHPLEYKLSVLETRIKFLESQLEIKQAEVEQGQQELKELWQALKNRIAN